MEKRLREISEGLERLRAMPLRGSVQVAAEKVEMLKRRLQEIRMAMLFMTPEQAKAFARELKQIAGALSDAARNAGAGAGAASISSGTVAGSKADEAAEINTAAAAVTTAPSDPSNPAHAGTPTAQAALAKASATNNDDTRLVNAAETNQTSAKSDRERLHESLKTASDALRAALELLKSRLKDEEGRKISKELAQAIQDLDEQRMRLDSSGLYDAHGAVAAISGLAFSFGSISVRA